MPLLSDEEVDRLRSETAGTAMQIHFNNAGASLPPDIVVDTMIRYLREEALAGGYEMEAKHRDELNGVYTSIAKLINAEDDEIALMTNASTAWQTAFLGLDLQPGDEVIVSEMEYVSNLITLFDCRQRHGIEIKLVPGDASGNTSADAFAAAITPKTKLIAATHIGSGAGTILPVAEIGKIAKQHGILFLVDACQSVGQMPVDVREIGCDMLSVTGRKYLRAPRGTGFLFVRKEIQHLLKPVFMDGSSTGSVTNSGFVLRQDSHRFEVYESNRALVLALGRAADYAMEIGLKKIRDRIKYVSDELRNRLREINGITVHDDGKNLSGIVTFSSKAIASGDIRQQLLAQHINVSVALPHSTLFYAEKKELGNLVRASVHYYNTIAEIDLLCEAVAVICAPGIEKITGPLSAGMHPIA